MSDSIDALVVGGGPVGLALACELYRHGRRCRIIEVKTEREVWSKAAGIQPRTLEVFQHMGISDRIVSMGSKVLGADVYANQKLLVHVELHPTGTPFPFMLGLSQKRTEEALEAHLESLGGRLERGVELVDFTQDGDGVSATLRHLDGSSLGTPGQDETLRVPWMVGCDGAHSTVRRVLDLPFEGSTFEQGLIHADLRARFPFEVPPNHGLMFVSETGAVGFLPLFGDDHFRLIVMAPPEDLSEPTLDNFREIVRQRAPGFDIELFDPDWLIGFRFHSRVVPGYRHSRVFLAGDAAHIHSPAGAQGMNLGIQDAFNLGWKLALVQAGGAPESLLDSYDVERRPVGKMIVDTTDTQTRRALRAMTLRNPVAVAIRNQLMKFILGSELFSQKISQAVGGMNVGYEDSPIVGQYHSSIWNARIGRDAKTETPDVRSWRRFESGPAAGKRVSDAELPAESSTLFELMTTTKHVLLLFDGAAATDEGYANLSSIASTVSERYGDRIEVHVVIPHGEVTAALSWRQNVLHDPDAELHDHFGAQTESLYLIRPDGYVGYRSQPADAEHLCEYLGSVFGSSSGKQTA